MKYAYIIGTSAFIVPSKVISYLDEGEEKEFLRINSVYHDQDPKAAESFLECDLDIKTLDGTAITLVANKAATGAPYKMIIERDSIQVLKSDGEAIISIHQLDDESAMSLEHNITAELEVSMPVAVIRIFGEFMLGSLYIKAENEKLFINHNGYANSVQAGKNQLQFTPDGVSL